MKKGRHRRFEEARKLKQAGPSAFDLGLAVYIHELAHLFSHRGLDQDGSDWDTDCFQNSSTYTLESIAQWYTFLVVAGRDEETVRALPGYSRAFSAWMLTGLRATAADRRRTGLNGRCRQGRSLHGGCS